MQFGQYPVYTPVYRFDSPNVLLGEGVEEWLGTRYTWVLQRARKRAPTHAPKQIFLVTNEGVTKQVEVADNHDEVVVTVAA